MIKSNGLNIQQKQGKQDLLALHKSNPTRYPFLLESVASTVDSNSHNFDILFAFPQETLTLSNKNKLTGYDDVDGNDFLDNLSHWWKTQHLDNVNCEALPFSGGWFLYLGYELAQQVEPHLHLKSPSTSNAYATRVPAAIIFSHNENCTYFLCEEQDRKSVV